MGIRWAIWRNWLFTENVSNIVGKKPRNKIVWHYRNRIRIHDIKSTKMEDHKKQKTNKQIKKQTWTRKQFYQVYLTEMSDDSETPKQFCGKLFNGDRWFRVRLRSTTPEHSVLICNDFGVVFVSAITKLSGKLRFLSLWRISVNRLVIRVSNRCVCLSTFNHFMTVFSQTTLHHRSTFRSHYNHTHNHNHKHKHNHNGSVKQCNCLVGWWVSGCRMTGQETATQYHQSAHNLLQSGCCDDWCRFSWETRALFNSV